MAVYQIETEKGTYEIETEDPKEKMVGSIFGKVPESKYAEGERNFIGNIFERPGAAIRSALQGKGYVAGAINPTNVPTFQDLAIGAVQKSTNPVVNAIVGMPASALGLAADIATNPVDVLSYIIPATAPAKAIGRAISASSAGKAVSAIANAPIEELFRPSSAKVSQKISSAVKEGIQKGVRPSVVGKQTAKMQETYFQKAESAVKDVIANKENLEILDKGGEIIYGKAPKSVNEALQAVSQTREMLFDTYSPIIKDASSKGAVVNGDDIARKLRTFSSKESIQLSNPQLAQYAEGVAQRWEGKTISLDTAEETAKEFNAMLKQKYQQGRISGADVSSAHVDDMVVRELRNAIAEKAGVGDLKQRYGALAELEKDLAKRAIVSGRQNKIGLVESMATLDTAADITGGVMLSAMTQNPAYLGFAARGIGAKVASGIIKNLNSPDENISRMFKTVEKLQGKIAPKPIIPEVMPREGRVISRRSTALPDPKEQLALPNLSAEKRYNPVRDPNAINLGTDVSGAPIQLTKDLLPPIEEGVTRLPDAGTGVPVGTEFESEAALRRRLALLKEVEKVQSKILNPTGDESSISGKVIPRRVNSPSLSSESVVKSSLKDVIKKTATQEEINAAKVNASENQAYNKKSNSGGKRTIPRNPKGSGAGAGSGSAGASGQDIEKSKRIIARKKQGKFPFNEKGEVAISKKVESSPAERFLAENPNGTAEEFVKRSVDDFQSKVKASGTDFRLHLRNNGDLRLDHIVVPKGERGRGVGSSVMKELTKFADDNGLRLVLNTAVKDDAFGTTSAGRLKKFYKRFGFVENKGKDYSISENMFRVPQETKSSLLSQFNEAKGKISKNVSRGTPIKRRKK